MVRLRTVLAASLAAAALALLAPARADAEGPDLGLGEGARAPAFDGKDFVNTEPVSLQALRGRVVLLELFSVT